MKIAGLTRVGIAVGIAVGKKALLAFTKSGISNLIGSSTNFAKARLDVGIENKEFTEYVKDIAEAIVKDVVAASFQQLWRELSLRYPLGGR